MRAILVADIHLQAHAPVVRSSELDWFEAQARPLNEIRALSKKHQCPILYAGDIFDRWNAAPEIINFAFAHLPPGWAVPGQHDLPNHSYAEIERSAYWTLVAAGYLVNILPGERVIADGLPVTGWPWGFEPIARSGPRSTGLPEIALIHRFVWTKDTGYPGAPTSALVGAYKGCLGGYDVAVFGDNHKGFVAQLRNGPCIISCGTIIRRKADERDYRPSVWLLHEDATITRYYLDTTKDKFIELTAAEEVVERLLNMTEFVVGLRGLGVNDALDFVAVVKRFLTDNNVSGRVRDIILGASERG